LQRIYERDNLAEIVQILIDHGVKLDALDGAIYGGWCAVGQKWNRLLGLWQKA